MNTISLQVIWALNVGRVGVRRDELTSKFQDAGLRVPRPPSKNALLTRASQAVQTGRPWLGMKRLAGGGIGLISHDVDSRDRLNPKHFATAFSVNSNVKGDLTFQHIDYEHGSREHEVLTMLAQEFANARDYATATDLRSILQRAVRGSRRDVGMGGVPVVGNGVQAYWVPARFRREVQSLQSIVEDLSEHSRVDVFEMSDTGNNLHSIQRHVRHQRLQELGDLREEVRELVASNDGATAQKTIDAKLEAFNRLDGSVDLWKDVLGDIQDELVQGIAEVRAQLRDELGIDDAVAGGPVVSGPGRRLFSVLTDREENDSFNLAEAVELLTDDGHALSPARVRQLLLELNNVGFLTRDPEAGRGFYRVA